MAERFFILRDTINPDGDLQRGFSGNVNAWFDSRERAQAYADANGVELSVKQCPISKKWCGDPEKGLSGYAFSNETELSKAMESIATYVEWRDNPTLTVFASNEVEKGVGLDGEDVFREGWKVITLAYPFTWSDFEAALKPSISSEPEAVAHRAERATKVVQEMVEQWIADPMQSHVESAWCITQGPCAEFAGDVFMKLIEEFPGLDIAIENSDDVAVENDVEFAGYHAFLRVDNRYYDSQEQGVFDPVSLPFLQREYKYAIMARDEGWEDHEEEGDYDEDATPAPML